MQMTRIKIRNLIFDYIGGQHISLCFSWFGIIYDDMHMNIYVVNAVLYVSLRNEQDL